LLIGLIVAAVATFAVISSGTESETYFLEVDEAVARGSELHGEVVRIKGIVEPGSITGTDGELGRSFLIAAKGKSIEVHYDRALPDTFKEGMDVVAQGRLDERGVMDADEVVVKCPSRYEGQPPTAHEAATGPRASREAASSPTGEPSSIE
jgi:cytochrome c-type biogenesis protein CcmE